MKKEKYDVAVERFLRKFTPAYIVEEIFNPIDTAYMKFEGKFVTTKSYEDFLDELLRFHNHIWDSLLPMCKDCNKPTRDIQINSISKSFDACTHFFNVESGRNGGIRSLMENYINDLKTGALRECIKTYLYEDLEIVESDQRCYFMQSFCRKVGYDFLSDIIHFWYHYDEALYDYLQAKFHIYKHIR